MLDARDRIGGRLHTVDLGGSAVDLGGSWIHGPIDNPMADLARQAGVVGYLTTFSEDPAGMVVCDVDGRRRSAEAFSAGVNDFWRSSLALRSGGPGDRPVDGPDRSFLDVAGPDTELGADRSRNGARAGGFSWARDVGLQSLEAADTGHISLDAFDYEERPGGDLLLADGGYRKLVDVVAEGLDVRLSSTVERISGVVGGGFELIGPAGEVPASDVVVTASIGVLQAGAIDFDPPLPAPVRAAIDRIGMGTAEKLAVRFAEAPWPVEATSVAVVGTEPDDPFASWVLRTDAPIAISYAGGRRARRAASLADEAFLQAGLDRLTAVFGPLRPVTGWRRTTWTDDPWARGAYSYNRVGGPDPDAATARATLAEAVLGSGRGPGRLVLAGEATSPSDYGTAHGAWLSGVRAADRLLVGAESTAP